MSFVSAAIYEASGIQSGVMHNSILDLMVLNKLGVLGSLTRSLKIILVYWSLNTVGLIKVNTNGVAKSSPGSAGGGGVFKNQFSTMVDCFLSFWL